MFHHSQLNVNKMTTLKELKAELKKRTKVVYDMDKEKRSSMFKSLSKYSQNLFKEEYQKAVSDQFDIIEKIVDLTMSKSITEDQAMAAVNTATKH